MFTCLLSVGEMRILESQRHKILDQLEKCPSSGDEAESPKKRAKYSQDVEDHHFPQNNHHESSTTNCNGKVLDHREHSSLTYNTAYNYHRHYHSELAHRKTVEIRRLSDCNIKHTGSVPGGAMTSNYTKSSRRPSTDSISRYSNTQIESYQLHKRRKTSAGASTSSSSSSMTANEMEVKSRLNPIHSFEASGGESEHGSRPDTPLFDERPENALTDPRLNRPRIPSKPLDLPLPKFAQSFHQQLRQTNQLFPASHAIVNTEKYENSTLTSAFAHHSSLKHKSVSPSPQHHPVRSRSNSIMPPVSSGSSISETLLTSPRPPSLTSNSSDSEQELSTIGGGPSTSPSLEERLKKLSEDYDSWSSNGRSSSSSHYMNSVRHSVPEISVPETPELLRNVLKNSMFDEDTKRLENINTQAPTSTSITVKNNFSSFNSSHLSISGTSSPLLHMGSICSSSTVSSAVVHQESLLNASSLAKIHMPAQQPVISSVIQHRLGSSSTGSPMNSPNTASPYNSPNPSSASSISSIKGLQYPFPSHQTATTTSCSSIVSNVSTASIVSSCLTTMTSTVTSMLMTSTAPTVSCSQQQKPKTCTLNKSVSLQETSFAATGTNNNNNFNASFNKSSTNNLNNNSSNDIPPTTSKQLVKSISLPSCGNSSVEAEPVKVEEKKIDEPVHAKVQHHEDQALNQGRKEPEIVEKSKSHTKERRKNSEHEDHKDDVKEHSKKEKEQLRKEKENKKNRDKECPEDKKVKLETQKALSKKMKAEDSCSEDTKKEDVFERAPSPAIPQMQQRKQQRRASTDDMSGVDSSIETQNHVDNCKDSNKKESKHHEANKTNSKHHHKERKNSIKEKQHNNEDEMHTKISKQHSDLNSSKDSIFDELKRNTKDNIIKTNDKVHKTKKHHHNNHRDNGNRDKENQTHHVPHYNDTSSAIITDDLINRSSEDDNVCMKHNHNGKKQEFSSEHEHETTANHKKIDDHHTKIGDESNGRKKFLRRSNISSTTDDTEDSDTGNKKTSIFDILDDGPNISMYDKVKARSCKNLKKQEEEKKIKDKFTALKQSRAKREKKRLNTSEDDSDSDIHDTNSNDMFQNKFKKSHLSASDDEMRESEDEIVTKKNKNRHQLSIVDDESSESGINVHDGHRKKNKFFNRKNSRNVIDSSDEDMPVMVKMEAKPIEIKQEPLDSFDELKKDTEFIKSNNKHTSKKRHHDKNKDDKANKKSKKISKEHHRKSTSSTDSMQKREEDIFGSVSEDDQLTVKADIKNNLAVVLTDIKKEKNDGFISSDAHDVPVKERQREESKKRKEKRERRREREKQRIIKEEENSVDLDEAGRALEAQLMSDSDHKMNNNDLSKELKSEDVFHFTDDEIKRDHHDSIKKKKKKKRTKEERKHHNHNHYDNIKQEPFDSNLESVSTFNNNNNTKMKLDVVCEDIIKPSLPSLITEDAKIETKSPQLLSPVSQTKKEAKLKPEATIPGFGGVPIDEAVHEKAVMSIAAELEKKPIVIKEEIASISTDASILDKKPSKPEIEKPEEKSRVIISQEETEDAVAALLGESFSMTHEDYNDPYDVPIVTTDNDNSEIIDEAMIPPEEDEEMKKAIMSLNSEIERKIDTPQSEHDLQIDTDTEEPAEDENLSNPQMSFDEPPKTPDVDVSQSEKDKLDHSDTSIKSMKIVEEATKEASSVDKTIVIAKQPAETPKAPEKVEEQKKEEPKVDSKLEKTQKPSGHRYEPPSIIIPTEQSLSYLEEKLSPRKHPFSPTKAAQVYSPITPASGKDSQSNIFSMAMTNTPKLSPAVVSTTQPVTKVISIPNKTENKTVLINTGPVVQAVNVTKSTPVEPMEVTQSIQIIPKLTPTPADRKMEIKPTPSTPKVLQTAPRQPQIIFPPTTSAQQVHTNKNQQQQETSVESKETKSNQWQAEPNSVIQKTQEIKEEESISEKKVEKPVDKKEPVSEASQDDEEGSTHDHTSDKENPSTKKTPRGGGKQRGRKNAAPQSPPHVQQPIPEEIPSSPQTRRGGKTAQAAKRGRGGKQANAKNIVFPQQPTIQSPPQATGMRQQKTSESDVYEFHDDSGEELMKTGDQKPRLIMTIKTTANASSTVTHTVTQTIANPPSTVVTAVSTIPATTTVISSPQQSIQESPQDLPVPPSLQQHVPSPAHSDEFVQPGNTRKSKRLLEKDVPRTSVDDTIDDVIRNSTPVNQSILTSARPNRVTRQNPIPQGPVVQTSLPISTPQPVMSTTVEPKKHTRMNKKQKDRKISETSESETEKKDDKINAAVVSTAIQTPSIEAEVKPILSRQPVQQEPPKIIQIPTMPVPKPTQEVNPVKKDGTELLQLIDPVTGELQKMTQSKEGQYVPVSENRSVQGGAFPPATQTTPIIVSQPATIQPIYHIEPQKQQPQQTIPMPHHQQPVQDEKKIISTSMPHNVIKVSSPVVIEPPKSNIITEPSHVIKPVITQNPQAASCKPIKNYIYNTQSVTKTPVTMVNTSIPNPPTTVISSQNMVKMNVPTGIVQQPPTIYNLGNIIPSTVANTKYVSQPSPAQAQQKTIVMPHSQTTIIHPVPPHSSVSSIPQSQQKPQIIHQKVPSSTSQQPQIVIHPQTHQMPLIAGQQHPAGNLMINIPNSSNGSPSIPSPSRIAVKQVIQRTVPQQIPSQQMTSATVVVKSTQQPGQQTHVVGSQEAPKISQPPTRTTYIPPGSKIVDPQIGYAGNREVIFVDGKHKMYPNYQTQKYAAHQQPLPSPTQAKPQQQQIVQQIPSQVQQIPVSQHQQTPTQSQQQPKILEKIQSQPQVSVQHIPMPIPHQQKVYITGSGQVISNIPISSQTSEGPGDRQQWITHEKTQTQPLKRYVMDYEEAHTRVQQGQPQASPIPRKQTFVIETPSGHPSQPVHHPPVVNHPSKTIIGLNQPPQILTGAVASPPLKAHMSSQQPIVTGNFDRMSFFTRYLPSFQF